MKSIFFLLRVFLLIFITSESGRASDDLISIHISQSFRTKDLNAESSNSLRFYSYESSVVLDTYSQWNIHGCLRDEFKYTSGNTRTLMSQSVFDQFTNDLDKLDLASLDSDKREKDGVSVSGSIEVAYRKYEVHCAPDNPALLDFNKLKADFLDQHKPSPDESSIFTYTIQGEHLPAQSVSFANLVANPAKYAGKRVRLCGYYHLEFEGNSFSENKNIGDYQKALWPGEFSSFLDSPPPQLNDVDVCAEGTFEWAPGRGGGHMGMWLGDFSRITKLEVISPKPLPTQP